METKDINTLRQEVDGLELARDELICFFDQSIDMHCVADNGYFKRLNPAWTSCLGWSLEELMATPFIVFVHPSDCESTQMAVSRMADGKDAIRFENRYRHKDGSYHWLQWNARLAPGRDQIYATARDMTRQRNLEMEVLNIAEQEKSRLGYELHDGLCQTLAGIAALSAALAMELAAASDSEAAAKSKEITKLTNRAIGDARDMARGLGSVNLTTGGFFGALETLCASIEHMFRVPCTLASDDHFPSVDTLVATHLYRIVQEASSNAISHSRANQIEINLTLKNGRGLLSVRDDGVGISDEVLDSARGIGMHTMAYRARVIGGSLNVRKRTQRGTAVTCSFPLSDDYEAQT